MTWITTMLWSLTESDILGCKVKWALGSITTNKAGRGDEIPAELFPILKDNAVKVLHSVCQQIWKTQQCPQYWKSSIFIPIPKKGNAKKCWHCHTIVLILHASKVMLKILLARLQQYMNWKLLDVQAGFRKGRVTRDQIANSCWIIDKKGGEFQKKTSTYPSLTIPKPLTVWITTNLKRWEFLKRWKCPTTLSATWETCMQVKKQEFELNMEEWTCF